MHNMQQEGAASLTLGNNGALNLNGYEFSLTTGNDLPCCYNFSTTTTACKAKDVSTISFSGLSASSSGNVNNSYDNDTGTVYKAEVVMKAKVRIHYLFHPK